MRKVSRRQASVNRQVNKILRMKADYLKGICPGCNQRKPLTPSHLIRRSQRPDLVTNPLNISPDCLDCHRLQDSGDINQIKRLRDWKARLSVIEVLDPEFHYRLIHKMK
jgi:hypothetical protein